jgi:hypothetical protein
MSLTSFMSSQLFKQKSPNLSRIGYDFDEPIQEEFFRVQGMLFNMYHIRQESMLSMMKIFNIPSPRTMTILFDHFDIESKSLEEAGYQSYDQHRGNIPSGHVYKSTTHTTWEGKKVYLRSSYEINYALLLDNEKVSYDVECVRLKYFDTQLNRHRIAIPDFFLPSANTIVEVKSQYFLDVINMKDKFKSYQEYGFIPKLLLEGKMTSLYL